MMFHLPHANIQTMLEYKNKGILSLNLNKLANRVDDVKMVLILQNEMLLLMLFCKPVPKQGEDIPNSKTVNNSSFGTLCSTIFCTSCFFKNILMHLSTKVVGKKFPLIDILNNLLLHKVRNYRKYLKNNVNVYHVCIHQL